MLDALRKFWFALNSAQNTKSLSIAIAFGIIVGLTPTMSLHNFIIFFIVLIFWVHLGLFLLSAAFFSFVGFLFDPLFHKLGQSILTSETLNGFFTTLYNLPLMKLSEFNNTILMGSLVISIILAPLAYIGAQLLFSKYRDIAMTKLSHIPFVGKMFFNETKALKKQSRIRKSGIIAFVGVCAFFGFIVFVLLDPIIKYTLVKTVEQTTDKEVSIDQLKSNLFKGNFHIEGFKLIDNDNVIASFDKLFFELKPSLLFDKKIIIEKFELNNLNLNKQTVALLSQTPQDKNKQSIAQKMSENLKGGIEGVKDNFKIPTVEQILAKEDLESVKRAKQIEKDLQSLEQKYKSFQNDLNPDKIKELQSEIESFQKDLEGMKDPTAILNVKSKFDKLQKDIEVYQKRYANVYTDINKEFTSIQKNINNLDKIAQQDLQRLKDKYTSVDGLFSVMSLFTKGQNAQYLQKIYNAYLKVKPYLQSDKPKEQKKVYYRDLGQYIIYEDISSYPRVAIYEGKVDGVYENTSFDTVVTNYSTNQFKTQKPTLVIATAKSTQFENFEMKLLNDTYSSNAKTTLNLYVKEFNAPKFQNDAFSLKSATLNIQLQSDLILNSDTIASDVLIDFSNVSFDAKGSDIANALSQINSFDLQVDSLISADQNRLKLDSNAKSKFTKIFAKGLIKSQAGFSTDLEKGIFQKMDIKELNTQSGEISTILGNLKEDKNAFGNLSQSLTKSFTQSQSGDGKKSLDGLMKNLF